MKANFSLLNEGPQSNSTTQETEDLENVSTALETSEKDSTARETDDL